MAARIPMAVAVGTTGEAVAGEHLPHEDGERREQDGREHEAVPEQLQRQAAGIEPAQDLSRRVAQDVRVVEAPREQKEEDVERQRQQDEERAGGVVDVHATAPRSGSRNNRASTGQVSSANTSAPLAPKFVTAHRRSP
jgi:hypothetical protein